MTKTYTSSPEDDKNDEPHAEFYSAQAKVWPDNIRREEKARGRVYWCQEDAPRKGRKESNENGDHDTMIFGNSESECGDFWDFDLGGMNSLFFKKNFKTYWPSIGPPVI